MARVKRNHPPGVVNPATVAAVRGAGSLHLDGFRQPGIYRTGGAVATILRECRNDDGHFVGLEVAR